MLAGIVLGAALVVALLMLFSAGKFAFDGERNFVGVSIAGLLAAGAVIAVVLNAGGDESGSDDRTLRSGIPVASAARASSSLFASEPVPPASTRVAPVPSLIEGLESRLASEPDNASGWALLAQSYAFVGNTDGADAAIRRAVDLGLDEADLRQRVQSARRDAHAGLQAGLTR